MNKYIILIISLITLAGCAQNKEEMDNKVKELWGDLYKDVKYHNQSIDYRALIFIGGCNYEVLINDFLIDNYFGLADGASSGDFSINDAINKPGIQTWKIRIYPIHDRTEIDGNPFFIPRPFIEEGARAELKIEGIRFKDNGDVETIYSDVVDFKAPLKTSEENGRNIFADAGKPYIEYSGTFEAKVPYHLSGWENSEDLTKMNISDLTDELVKEYKKYITWVEDRSLDKIAKDKLNAEKEYAQAHYFTKSDNDRYVDSFIKNWGYKGLIMVPLENYAVKFYGNGKIVVLEKTDVVGYPVLLGQFKLGERERVKIFYIYFHRPRPGAPLEVIR